MAKIVGFLKPGGDQFWVLAQGIEDCCGAGLLGADEEAVGDRNGNSPRMVLC
jgi:hypothetical protein